MEGLKNKKTRKVEERSERKEKPSSTKRFLAAAGASATLLAGSIFGGNACVQDNTSNGDIRANCNEVRQDGELVGCEADGVRAGYECREVTLTYTDTRSDASADAGADASADAAPVTYSEQGCAFVPVEPTSDAGVDGDVTPEICSTGRQCVDSNSLQGVILRVNLDSEESDSGVFGPVEYALTGRSTDENGSDMAVITTTDDCGIEHVHEVSAGDVFEHQVDNSEIEFEVNSVNVEQTEDAEVLTVKLDVKEDCPFTLADMPPAQADMPDWDDLDGGVTDADSEEDASNDGGVPDADYEMDASDGYDADSGHDADFETDPDADAELDSDVEDGDAEVAGCGIYSSASGTVRLSLDDAVNPVPFEDSGVSFDITSASGYRSCIGGYDEFDDPVSSTVCMNPEDGPVTVTTNDDCAEITFDLIRVNPFLVSTWEINVTPQ
jgi:hypothetical protein